MRNIKHWQFSITFLASTLGFACGGSSSSEPPEGNGGTASAAGGAGSGGSGLSSAGTSSSSGGEKAVSGGSSNANGGNANGGNANASGGASSSSGGSLSPSGGSVTNGGRNAGGASSGGASSGGASAGGRTGAGGSASGGSASGGASNGSGGTSSGCSATGFYVQDGLLYDVKCKEFTIRGINYPYTWFSSRSVTQDFNAIAATGANTVRIVLSTGNRWTKTSAATLTSLINAAKAAKLVSVLEVHDTTGYSEQSGSVALTNATSYWSASDVAAAIKGQEAYVIINIGNEPNGNNTASSWASSHVTSVQALRSAGLNHTLMVDGPDWAQDWRNTMRGGGGVSIWNADTKKNLVFSVHMYDVYESSSLVSTYFNTFLSNYDAPLVVGEFAADHGAAGDVDEASIMSYAEMLGIGYMGWSWAGNSNDLATLNITNNFDASSLTTWGTRLINGDNGIKATSQRCTCFN